MFCQKCGNVLRETDRFCQKCGAPVVSRPAETPSAAVQPGPASVPPVKSKKGVNLIALFGIVLLAAALAVGGFFFLRHPGGEKPDEDPSEPSGAATEDAEAAETPGEEPAEDGEIAYQVYDLAESGRLTLSADRVTFFTDEDRALTLTVRVPADLDFAPITVTDSAGSVAASLAEDTPLYTGTGWRAYALPLSLGAGTAGAEELRASMGAEKSPPLTLLTTPRLTADMVSTCAQVGADLTAYVAEEKLEELFRQDKGDQALAAVLAWLEKDERIASAAINGDSVLYTTLDHVAGLYSPPIEEGYLGSGDEGEGQGLSVSFSEHNQTARAARSWFEKGTVSEAGGRLWLDGALSITNTGFLVLDPWQQSNGVFDSFIHQSGEKHRAMADAFAAELGYTVTACNYAESWAAIANGKLTDYGIVTLMCHGNNLERKDGTQCAVFFMPAVGYAEDVLQELERVLLENGTVSESDEFYSRFFMEDAVNPNHTLLMIASDGGLVFTANYLMTVYQDRFFDNTIFYSGSCKGASDETLKQFFINHGAKAYIGYTKKTSSDYEQAHFKSLFEALKKTQKDGTTTALSKAADVRSGKVNYAAGLVYRDWHIAGSGELSGKVREKVTHLTYTRSGEVKESEELTVPETPPEFSLYLFRDQRFDIAHTFTPDKDGSFRLKDVAWGVYGIQHIGEEEDDYWGFTMAGTEVDGGTLAVPAPTAAVTAEVFMEEGGELIPADDCRVTLEGVNRQGDKVTYTAETGSNRFELKGLEPGEYTLSVTSGDLSYSEPLSLMAGYSHDYEALILSGGAVGNGTPVVRYDGRLYYWRLKAENVSSEGTFAYYYYQTNTAAELVSEKPDGSDRRVVYSGKGCGELAIGGGRIYFIGMDADHGVYRGLYSVALDGTGLSLVDSDNIYIQGASDKAGLLVYATSSNYGSVCVLDLKTGQVTARYEGSVGLIKNDEVYCYKVEASGTRLFCLTLGDTVSQRSLGATPTLAAIYGSDWSNTRDGAFIYSMQIAGDYLYYAAGVTAGTGNFFQGGPIQRVPLQGGTAETLVEATDDIFYVEEQNGSTLIYFMPRYPAEYTPSVYDVSKGTTTPTDKRIMVQGEYFYDGPQVMVYADASGQPVAILGPEDLGEVYTGDMGGGTQGYDAITYAQITDHYRVGDLLYFTLEVGDNSDRQYFGWRAIFTRTTSALMVKDLRSGVTRVINQY